MTRVMVTGATGFVGRTLCPALKQAGFDVTAAVRRADAVVPGADRVVVVPDIGSDTDWTEALRGAGGVVHLAARVHRMGEGPNDAPADNRRINAEGTRSLAEAAGRAGIGRLVFLSTIKVNGDATGGRAPFVETDAPAPTDSYAVSKCDPEQALVAVAASGGPSFTILRPPLVYGEGVGANFRALLGLCRRAPPLPFASVDNRRSLIYVGNLADAIVRVLAHPGAAGRTFLVRDGEDVSTPELMRRIGRALGRPQRLFPCPPGLLRLAATALGKGPEIARLLDTLAVDDRQIRRDAGWSPPFTLNEGLARTAAWFAALDGPRTKGS